MLIVTALGGNALLRRGEPLTAEVIDGPASAVWEQAANRLPTEQAVVRALVTGRWEAS